MIKVGIIGVNGYGGGELLRLLAGHPQAEVTVVASRSQAGRTIAQVSRLFAARVGDNWSSVNRRRRPLTSAIWSFWLFPTGSPPLGRRAS